MAVLLGAGDTDKLGEPLVDFDRRGVDELLGEPVANFDANCVRDPVALAVFEELTAKETVLVLLAIELADRIGSTLNFGLPDDDALLELSAIIDMPDFPEGVCVDELEDDLLFNTVTVNVVDPVDVFDSVVEDDNVIDPVDVFDSVVDAVGVRLAAYVPV